MPPFLKPLSSALLAFAVLAALFPAIASAQTPARFEPPAGKRLFIVGQDLASIGGFKKPHNDGYTDHITPVPGGLTTYASLPFLAGLKNKTGGWAGDLWAQGIIDNPIYKDSVLAIGLHMVDMEQAIADGTVDKPIEFLANWVKATKRPVFLRIGYEFDGSWNHYKPEPYRLAFQRIVTIFRRLEVKNCAFVWQSATSPVNGYNSKDINAWYPGDEFVDWFGYSWFLSGPKQVELTQRFIDLAKAHGKPVMVCESAPQGYDLVRLTRGAIHKGKDRVAKTPEQIWKEWYAPFFAFLETNQDTVKAVAYINCNWDIQPMWGPPYNQGYWGDTRVEVNPEIKTRWLKTITEESWLHASPTLFKTLGY